MHVMTREAWTDERLDDLAKGVGEVRAEVRELRGEVGQVREELAELRVEIKGMEKRIDAKFESVDAKFEAMNRTLQIGFGLIGSVLVGILGMFATQL